MSDRTRQVDERAFFPAAAPFGGTADGAPSHCCFETAVSACACASPEPECRGSVEALQEKGARERAVEITNSPSESLLHEYGLHDLSDVNGFPCNAAAATAGSGVRLLSASASSPVPQ
ncbi:unnamed protein product [Eretmochelys imbricata]